MKAFLLVAPVAFSILASSAFAENFGRRYKADYASFDSGFHRQYHYREFDSKCRFNTCMESTFKRTDVVYIEETVITDRTYGQQRMVRVYESERYETSIVTYYVYNDGPRSHVGGRRFNEHHHHHHYYYTPYVMPGLVLTAAMMDNFDEQSAALLLAGGVVFDLGLNVAAGCKGDEDCAEAAGVIALIGIASSVSASISNEVNKNSKTELEKQIELAKKSSADNI